eukprot:3001569-Pyramimonas_sp.AAC.1
MRIPNPGYPPSSSSTAPPLGGYIHSLPRAVGEAFENEGQQIRGGGRRRRDRREGREGQEGGRTMICAATGDSACATACASHSSAS